MIWIEVDKREPVKLSPLGFVPPIGAEIDSVDLPSKVRITGQEWMYGGHGLEEVTLFAETIQ